MDQLCFFILFGLFSSLVISHNQRFKPASCTMTSMSQDFYRAKEDFDRTKAGVKGLLDSGVLKIPKIFVHPPENLLHTLSSGTCCLNLKVPVIDLEGVEGGKRAKTVGELREASESWGIFQLVNHGIPGDILEEMIEGIQRFHEQLREVKMEWYSREHGQQVRFYSNGDLYVSKAVNWRDSISCHYADGVLDPNALPGVCRREIKNYMERITKLKYTLAELLSEALGLDADYLAKLDCIKTATLVCHYYPSCPEPDLTLGATKHSDPSFMTILLQDSMGGLQVLHKNQWVDVQPVKGALIWEFFATAGVNKKIKVFEYDSILNENQGIHFPLVEIPAGSKLSSICWNPYIKSQIASSNFEGVVQLWDVTQNQVSVEMREHERRVWSVDFAADPKLLASGSDDASVKLWNINQGASVSTIRTRANVCCVQFPSDSSNFLAFGSADHKVYYYDLRNTSIPLCTLVGHKKTVSYIKFIDSTTLVSSSTDNTLKLWDLSDTTSQVLDCPLQSFTGHVNVKNFVGLSVSEGYIATGSETNEVFIYHKAFPMPALSYKFNTIDPISGNEVDENELFISSVCWRNQSSTLVAANSTGNIKVLEMV